MGKGDGFVKVAFKKTVFGYCGKKKRHPSPVERLALFRYIYPALFVLTVLSPNKVNDGLDNTVGHTETDNREGKVEASHENHMGHVPHPFKIKRKHGDSP